MNKEAEDFLQHNFHDALLKEIRVCPARSRGAKSSVRVTLEDYDENQLIEIQFIDPGNISFIGDFDVLRDNAGFGNTSHTKTISDPAKHLKTITQHQKKWNVQYDEGARSPIEKKLKSIQHYTSFKIMFFGATLEVLAQSCIVTKRQRRSAKKGLVSNTAKDAAPHIP